MLNGALYVVGGCNIGITSQTNVYRYPGMSAYFGISPTNGSCTGNYLVVISGTNLGLNAPDITNITLCGVAAYKELGYTQSATQIVVRAGAGTPGLGDVRVFSTSYGETVKSNAFTYTGSGMSVLGTNGTVIASGEPADAAKGTDFGHLLVGALLTNTFSITNTGNQTLTIGGVTTSGTGSASFQCPDMPSSIPAGAVSNFTVAFNPSAAGSYTAVLSITNNSTNTSYVVNLSGSACGLSTNIGPYAGGNTITITNGNFGNITNVLVGGVRAQISASGANWVTIILPASGSAGVKDIVIQTSDHGDITISGAYTCHPAGVIGSESIGSWTPLGGLTGEDYGVSALTINTNGNLVAGGDFYDGEELFCAELVGSNWTTIGTPSLDGTVYALTINTNGNLVAGGDLNVGGPSCCAELVGSNWTTIGTPSLDSTVNALTINTNDNLVAGGYFEGYCAELVGSTWTPLGTPSFAVNALTINTNGNLVAGGCFEGYCAEWSETPASLGVSPSSGIVAGAYSVTISGTNLCNGIQSDVTSVTLCGVAATVQSVAGSTQIVVTAGNAGVPMGPSNVVVCSTEYGTTTKANAFTYLGGGKLDQTITFTTISGQIVTNVLQLNATSSSSLPVSFTNMAGSPVNWQNSTTITFTATGTVNIVASQAGDATYNAAPSKTNTFTVLPAPTANGWLVIQVTPDGGSWALTAPAGYTGPTSGTGNLAAASAVTGAYGIAWCPMTGYVAPSNQTQFVTGGSTTLFVGVYLLISTNIGTPAGVAATEGTYTNKIRITWQGVAGAIGYEIWRSQTNDAGTAGRIADIPESFALRLQPSAYSPQPTVHSLQSTAYYYDDYNISPIYSYYYWVRAKTATLISPMSYVGMGYAALAPEAKTGTADIAVSDLVFLPVNVTNLSCAGTVSCRLANLGPDALNAAGVAFDYHMGTSAAAMVWIGSVQSNMTLAVGQEQLIILPPSAKRGLTVRGDLSGVQQVKVVVRHLSTLNDPNLANNTTTGPGMVRIKTRGVNSPGRSLNDYDGDGKSDLCLYQSALGRWYMELSGDWYGADLSIGDVGAGWLPVAGDYDGDGRTDFAAYDRLSGQWLVRFSSSGLLGECWRGGPEFTAAQCDIDGDAMTDPMVYREVDGYWVGAASSRQYAPCYTSLGRTGYQPVTADYDGDGLADPAVYNQTTGFWAIGLSGRGYQVVTGPFGGHGYLPATADYDGDGLADPAVYAPSTADWQVLLSGSLATQGGYTWWGSVVGDINGIPVPADYDGDGKADFAVYYQDTGQWQLFRSSQGYQELSGYFGSPEYQPVTE